MRPRPVAVVALVPVQAALMVPAMVGAVLRVSTGSAAVLSPGGVCCGDWRRTGGIPGIFCCSGLNLGGGACRKPGAFICSCCQRPSWFVAWVG